MPPVGAVLGLDVGTSTVKAVVLDRRKQLVGTGASDPLPVISSGPGAAEQDPSRLLDAVAEAIRGALDPVPAHLPVEAVAVAAQSGSVIPVDDAARPTHNLVTWMDSRAAPVVDGWSDTEHTLIRSVTGWAPTAGSGLSTIAWMSARQGRIGPAHRWASADDLVIHHLAGEWITNPSNAAGMQMMDWRSFEWHPDVCRIAAVEPSQLSRIGRSGETAGGLGPEPADSTGLRAGLPVVLGGHDQACAALALGAITDGTVVLSAGTAWVATAIGSDVDFDRLPSVLNLSPLVVDGYWSASQNLGGWGAAIENARTGPDPTRRDESVAEILERATVEVGRALDAIERSVSRPERITLVGGGARSSRLARLLAEVSGLEVTTPPDASWPALGAAILAAQGVGWSEWNERNEWNEWGILR